VRGEEGVDEEVVDAVELSEFDSDNFQTLWFEFQ